MQRNHRRQVDPQRTDSFLEKFAPSTKNQLNKDENRFDSFRNILLFDIELFLVKVGS